VVGEQAAARENGEAKMAGGIGSVGVAKTYQGGARGNCAATM